MGFGGMSFGSLLLIFLIILVLFGTKRLRSMGEDLGAALRNFKKGLQDLDSKEFKEFNADDSRKQETPALGSESHEKVKDHAK